MNGVIRFLSVPAILVLTCGCSIISPDSAGKRYYRNITIEKVVHRLAEPDHVNEISDVSFVNSSQLFLAEVSDSTDSSDVFQVYMRMGAEYLEETSIDACVEYKGHIPLVIFWDIHPRSTANIIERCK